MVAIKPRNRSHDTIAPQTETAVECPKPFISLRMMDKGAIVYVNVNTIVAVYRNPETINMNSIVTLTNGGVINVEEAPNQIMEQIAQINE